MKGLFLAVFLLFFSIMSYTQINLKTWKEDVRHETQYDLEEFANFPYDTTVIINDSEFSRVIDPADISISIDYCNKLLEIIYIIDQQKYSDSYTFKKEHFDINNDNNREIYFKTKEAVLLKFYKSENRFEIQEPNEDGFIITWQVFSGADLKIEEVGLPCRTFYDEPDDPNLYEVDLSLLEGEWYYINGGDTIRMLIKIDKIQENPTWFFCDSTLRPGVAGELCFIQTNQDKIVCDFHLCYANKTELRMVIYLEQGTYDDAYIRKLSNEELIFDYISSYFRYRKDE